MIERLLFLASELRRSDAKAVEQVFSKVEHGDLAGATKVGEASEDGVATILANGLAHREVSLSNALVHAAGRELDRYNRGLVVLDTAVTLGPLLGLLGTVVGMIRAFGVLGGESLAAKTGAITGGIAESLIAVSFGLGVAIVAILPLNYLTAKMERRRREIEDATNHLELLVGKRTGGCPLAESELAKHEQ